MPASVYSSPRSFFHRLWEAPPPSLGIEFSGDAVAAARWVPGRGAFERFAAEPLPEGALRPSPVRENFARPEEVRRAVSAALDRVARRAGAGGNVALFLPDVAARISVVGFDKLPDKAEDALPLVRWRLRKSLPFEIEEASVAWQRQGHVSADGGQQVLTAAAPRGVIAQYESALESLGYTPGFVTLSSLAALGLLGEATGADAERSRPRGTMFLRRSGGLLTIAVTSAGRVCMFRVTELSAGHESEPGSASGEHHTIDDVARDAYASSIYFQDNHGAAVERILIAGFGDSTGELEDRTERELGVRPSRLVVPGTRSTEEQFLGLYGMIAEQARE